MDYKTEMRKLIDIVKQQSFDAPLESTLEDLTTLSTAVKDLSDRINTRTKKSLNPNDKVKAKKKSKAKKVNPFPSVKPLPIATKPTATPAFIMPDSLPSLPVVPSADLPRPDICCFAKSAPLVTILIKISATAII